MPGSGSRCRSRPGTALSRDGSETPMITTPTGSDRYAYHGLDNPCWIHKMACWKSKFISTPFHQIENPQNMIYTCISHYVIVSGMSFLMIHILSKLVLQGNLPFEECRSKSNITSYAKKVVRFTRYLNIALMELDDNVYCWGWGNIIVNPQFTLFWFLLMLLCIVTRTDFV